MKFFVYTFSKKHLLFIVAVVALFLDCKIALSNTVTKLKCPKLFSQKLKSLEKHGIKGEGHPLMKEVYTHAQQVIRAYKAGLVNSILITGESGVGKELVVKYIVNLINKINGDDSNDIKLHEINASKLSAPLGAQELFGTRKGTYTGAENKDGLLGKKNAVIFIDEIGKVDFAVQKLILKSLDNGRYSPVGTTENKKIEALLIFAAREDLTDPEIMLPDLYYRFNYTIKLPTLFDLRSTIMPIAEGFLSDFINKIRKNNIEIEDMRFDNNTKKFFENNSWHGNFRELENLIRALIINSIGKVNKQTITISDIHKVLGGNFSSIPLSSSMHLAETVAKLEKSMIVKALLLTGGIQTDAARMLGTSRRILKYKMDALNIPVSHAKEPDTD